MANGNVDERIVEMQFDNQQFEKNANTTIGTLDKLKKSLNLEGAAKGFEEIGNASDKLDFGALQNSVSAIGDKFSMMGILGITAMQRISNAALDMGVNLTKTLVGLNGISEGFSRYAEKSNYVKTIMTATGASIEEVSAVLDDLNWFTDETSYRFTDMVNTMGKFTSAGVELNVAKEAVEGIALWAAESGQNAQTASRAMFQLAQAYGRGTIQLQDWMSIEQANMATSKIMTELTIEGGKAAEDAIAKYGGFRDSLRAGWMTTEVLNGVLRKYSEGVTEANYENGKFTQGVTEMSKAAFGAAQEARTYKDAIDAVKEAVATGWSQTFELLFGNAEEAAIVWTDLANALIAVSDKFTSFRNTFLESWNDLGGRDNIVTAAYNMMSGLGRIGTNLGRSWAQAMHFGKSLEEIKEEEWATSYEARVLISEAEKLQKQLGEMTERGVDVEKLEEWRGKIDDVMFSLNSMDRGHALVNLTDKVLKFSDSFKEMTHYEAAIKRNKDRIQELNQQLNEGLGSGSERKRALQRQVYDLNKILSQLGDGLKDSSRKKQIKDELQRLEKELSNLNNGTDVSARRKAIEEEIERLTKVNEEYEQFGKIWETAQKVWDGFLTVLKVIKEVGDNLLDIGGLMMRLFDPVLSLGGAIAHLVGAIGKALLGTGAIGEVVEDAGNTLENFLAPIIDFVAEKIQWLADVIEKVADDIEKGTSPISGWLTNAKEAILSFFKSLDVKAPKLEGNDTVFAKIGKVFSTLWKSTGTVAEKLGKVVSNVWEVLKDVFGKVADLLSKFVEDFSKTTGMGDNIVDNIVIFISKVVELMTLLNLKWNLEENPITAIADALYGVYYKFKGDAVKSVCQGLLYLAAALFVISAIDTDRLAQAAVVMEVLMYSVFKLVQALQSIEPITNKLNIGEDDGVLEKIKKSLTAFGSGLGGFAKEGLKIAKLYTIGMTLQKIGIAMLMLSGALFIIGQLKPEQMLGSVIVLGVVFKLLEGFMAKTTKLDGFKTNGLIKMAASLVIIASAIKKLGQLKPEELGKGIGAMGAILLEIVAFQALIDKLGRQNLFGSDKGLTGIGFGMIFIATSMIVFAKAIKSLGNLSVDELNQGLGAMVAVLAALAVALVVLKKTPVIGIAAGFLILSVAIAAIAATIALLGHAGLTTIGKGLLGVVVTIAAITTALAVLADHTIVGVNLIAAATAITIVAAALNLLMIPLLAFGQMSIEQVILSLVMLAGSLAIIGVAATGLGPSVVTLMGFGAALALIGVGLSAISIGITLLSTSLVAVVGSIVASFDLIVAGIGTFIAAVVFAIVGSVDSIVLGIAVLGKALLDAITILIDPILNLIGVLIDGIIKLLVDHGPVLIYGVIKILIDLMDAIRACLPEFIDSGLALAIGLIDGVARGIMEHSDDAVNSVTNLVNSLIYLFLTAIEGLLRDIPVIGDKVSETVGGWKAGIEDAMRDVGDSATDGVTKGLQDAAGDAKNDGKNLIGEIVNGANEAMPDLSTIGDSAKTYIRQGFTGEDGNASLFGTDLLTNEKNALLEQTGQFSEVGDSVKASIFSSTGTSGVIGEGGAAGEGSPTVLGANGLFDEIMDTLNARTPEAATIGEDTVTNVVTGMDNKQGDVETKSQEVADASEEPISELPEKFETHSTNAMQGLINGVDAMWDSVVGKFAALAAECSAQMSNVWGEHSPARVFIRHSRNAMLGLAIGVDHNSEIPIRSMRNVAEVMVDTVDETMNRMNSGDVAPTITPVVDLTNATGTVNSIGSMIAAQRSAAVAASMDINSQITQFDELVDVTSKILGSIQNGSDLYLDDGMIAGRINRRLGVL